MTNELSSLDYERGREAEAHHYSSVRSVLAYNATYRYYWGRMPGLAKALPVSGFVKKMFSKIKFPFPTNFADF